jgi:hypothetical protein
MYHVVVGIVGNGIGVDGAREVIGRVEVKVKVVRVPWL